MSFGLFPFSEESSCDARVLRHVPGACYEPGPLLFLNRLHVPPRTLCVRARACTHLPSLFLCFLVRSQVARLGARSYVRPSAARLAAAPAPKKDDSDLVKQLYLSELRKYSAELDSKKKKAVPVPDAVRVAAEAELELIKRRDALQHIKVDLPKNITLD